MSTSTDPSAESPPPPEDIFADIREQPEADAVPDERVMPLGDTGGLHDHGVEESIKNTRNKELGVHVPDKPETIPAPIQNPAMLDDTAGEDARRAAEEAFKDEIDQTKVVVTDDEKSMFLRATLHDGEVIFDIVLEGLDMKVSVAMPSEAFTAMAEMVVIKWGKDGHVMTDSRMQFMVAFQQIHLWHQIRAINGQPVPWLWNEDVPMTISNMRKFAMEYDNLNEVVNMPAAKHRLLMHACMIAELKYKICLTNLHDRTFFTGAATD